jgi:cell division protein FtsQ
MHVRIRDRRRAVSDAGRRKRRRILASVVALLLLVNAGVALSLSPLFAVREVAVVGAEGARADEVRAALEIIPGANLLLADVEGGLARVRRLPWVADAAVRRVAPSGVEVRVQARVPVAVLRQRSASWLLDAQGVLVGGGADPALAAIDAPDVALPDVGTPLGEGPARTALAVHTQLAGDLRALVDRYDADAAGPVRLHLRGGTPAVPPDGFWVVIGDAERLPVKEQAIRLFLDQVAPDPGACDLTTREWDVTTPENPFCTSPG